MVSRDEHLKRQRVLAQFGDFVLDNDDLQKVLDRACELVADALGADLAKILEIEPGAETALVRAGVGWRPGVVGEQRVDLNERSSEAYAIKKTEPVITNDLAHETRFHFPDFLLEHGVIALVNVPILLPGRKPYGVLQVDARQAREFDQDDIEFLKTYAMLLGPVVDRLKTVAELRRSDERLRLFVESARDYVVVLSDAEDRITDWLAGSNEILGWTAAEVVGHTTRRIFTEEDRQAGVPEQELAAARDRGAAGNVRWHVRKDGSRVFLDGQTIALRDNGGELLGYLKIAQDVTDRRRHEERQAVLIAELQHRVRNVLAMVRSIVRRTVAGGLTAEQISEQLEGRIDALARTQALLTRSVGAGVDLEGLVREELLAQASEEGVGVSGPPVQLAPKAAEVLTLAVHELATNSIKYGALGQPGARLSVEWKTERRGQVDWLRLQWRESGVRVAEAAPRRQGFGTELITRRVPYELDGVGRIELNPGGVECTIELPLIRGESILDTDVPD